MSGVPSASLRISDDVKASISVELHRQEDLDGATPDSHPRRYAEIGAKHLRNQLPAEELERLAGWCRQQSPWLTVANLPYPERPVPTPLDGFGDDSELTVPNLVHFGVLDLLGLLPVAYRWENDGRLVRNVAPRPGSAEALTSWGFSAPLDWHTDDSILDHHRTAEPRSAIPHYLSFYGMRNDEHVSTDLLPLDTVLRHLTAEAVDDLRRPEFTVVAPESYTVEHGVPMRRANVPLLWTLPGDRDAVRYGPGRVRGETPRAARALERFEELLPGLPGESVFIEAGDFLIFDNRRVLHRRVPFRPAADGVARWLRRCYAHGR